MNLRSGRGRKGNRRILFTEHRWLQLQNALASGRVLLDHTEAASPISAPTRSDEEVELPEVARAAENPQSAIRNPQLGTVGAVAVDSVGDLAAATSTGGMTNKKYGRVGDTALIGQGTYADELSAEVSCTGRRRVLYAGRDRLRRIGKDEVPGIVTLTSRT